MTVSVIETDRRRFTFDRSQVREDVYRASGNGGQNRNKVETAVRLRDLATGTVVTASEERSQGQNRAVAWRRLEAVLRERFEAQRHANQNVQRTGIVQRAERSFTWTAWRDEVKSDDGRRASYRAALSGQLAPLI